MNNKNTEKWFVKFYFVACCSTLMASKSSYVRVLSYIIRNTHRNNEFIKTFKEVARATACSESTVRRVISDLVSINFMVQIPQTDRHMVNPECLIRGTYAYYGMLKDKYNEHIKSTAKIVATKKASKK